MTKSSITNDAERIKKTPVREKLEVPEEVKQDFRRIGKVSNFFLGAICPPAYAAKTGITDDEFDNWYVKTKKALKKGIGTGVLCLALSYVGDGFMTHGNSRVIETNQINIEQGTIDLHNRQYRTTKNDSTVKKAFFPIVRFFSPNTYGWRESHTEFSGNLQRDGLEFRVNGRFPEIVNPEEVSLDDLRQNTTYVSVDRDLAFDYLKKE